MEVACLRREIPRAPQGWNPDQHEDTLTWGVNPYCEILSAPLQVSGLHNNLETGKERMSCMKLTVHSEPSRCINDTSDVLVAGRVTGSGHPSWIGQRAFFRPLLSTLKKHPYSSCVWGNISGVKYSEHTKLLCDHRHSGRKIPSEDKAWHQGLVGSIIEPITQSVSSALFLGSSALSIKHTYEMLHSFPVGDPIWKQGLASWRHSWFSLCLPSPLRCGETHEQGAVW